MKCNTRGGRSHLKADVRRRGADFPEALPRVLVEEPVSHVESRAAPHLFQSDIKKLPGCTVQGDRRRDKTERRGLNTMNGRGHQLHY